MNFNTLVTTSITQLEISGILMIYSINIVQKIKVEIKKPQNKIGKPVYKKTGYNFK